MSAPQGTDLHLGWGWETEENIWEGDPTHFLRAKSVSGIVAKRGYERVANMDSSGQVLKGIPTTARLAPKIEFEPDVNTLSPLLSHFCGKEPTISNLGTGAEQWLLTPREFSESAPATWRDSIFIVGSDGDGYPVINTGVRVTEWGLKISDGKLVSNSLSMLGCFDSYQSEATEVSNTGTYTGKPIIRGHRGTSQTGTLSCLITAIAGGGYDGTASFSLAAHAGSTEIDFVFDTWYRVTLDTGALLGVSRFESVWFCFPTATGAVAATDEWTFTATRSLATASYSSLDPLSAAGIEVTVGGVVKYFRDVEVKITRPYKHNTVAGSKYPIGIQKNGPWTVTVSLNRDRDDRAFLEKLISGESAAVVVDLYGNPLASSGFDERLKINLPNMQVTDAPRDITTATTLPEKIDLMAFRSGTTDLFDLLIQNSLATLT